ARVERVDELRRERARRLGVLAPQARSAEAVEAHGQAGNAAGALACGGRGVPAQAQHHLVTRLRELLREPEGLLLARPRKVALADAEQAERFPAHQRAHGTLP